MTVNIFNIEHRIKQLLFTLVIRYFIYLIRYYDLYIYKQLATICARISGIIDYLYVDYLFYAIVILNYT